MRGAASGGASGFGSYPAGLRRNCTATGLYSPLMRENLPAHLPDNLAKWIINETEVGTSALLDGLSQTELQFLAGAMMAKAEERPKSDQQLLRYLRATKRLQDRASGADVGR